MRHDLVCALRLRRLPDRMATRMGVEAAMTDLTREEYHKQMQALREVPKPAPHRLSLSDILTMVLNRSSHDSESVEISRNARGQFQFSVTVRTSEGETIEQAFDRGSAVVGQLVARFPYTENGG